MIHWTTWRDWILSHPDHGIRAVTRIEKVGYKTYTFYDIYKGDLLIAIE